MNNGKEEITKGGIFLSPPMEVRWKVPSFFSCPKGHDYYFYSPVFSYLDGTWRLQCCPNGNHPRQKGWMNLYLCNTYSATVHTITYQLGIRREDGAEYTSKTGTQEFKSGGGWGVINLIERASLLKDKRFVAPQDEITIFCVLRDRSTKDATSQTGRFEAIDVSTETTEEDFKNFESEVEDGEGSHIPAGTDKLAQSFKDVFLSGEYHDAILKVKDEEFRVHKLILVVRSPVFASMFRHDTIESRTGDVTIEDCDPKAFKEFLSYFYSGKVENLSTENVLELYFIADKYEVGEVKAKCVKFMINNFSVDNFCDFISLALRHNEKRVVKCATDYFVRNAKYIIVTVKWQCFHKEYPVESNELYIKAITLLSPE